MASNIIQLYDHSLQGASNTDIVTPDWQYVSATLTPADGNVALVAVASRKTAGGTPTEPSLTGWGQTWGSATVSYTSASGQSRLSVWVKLLASVSGGVLTWDWTDNQDQEMAAHSVLILTGGAIHATPVAQTATAQSSSSNALAVTFGTDPTTVRPYSATVLFGACEANRTDNNIIQGDPMIQQRTSNGCSDGLSIQQRWSSGPVASPTVRWSVAQPTFGIAIEIAHTAVGGGSAQLVGPGGLVQLHV